MPTLLLACLALSGCTVALHGHQATDGAATATASTTTTSSALRVQAGAGSARVSGSFGASAQQGAPGAQASFSRGASAVLIIGLLVAETLHYLGARFEDQPAPGSGPQRAIADTCSCYGYRPPETAGAALAD